MYKHPLCKNQQKKRHPKLKICLQSKLQDFTSL